MFENYTQTYRDRTYKFTTMVRHKGTLIAFAMDDKRRIVYSVLDLAGDAQTSVDTTNAKSPFDKDAWAQSPTELIFPTELAEVGFGVADQTIMPVVKKNSPAPEAFGTVLPAHESADAPKFDYFLSTTARLGADAPFQVLSDGQFLYVFRQAIAADHADMVSQRDKSGNVLLVAQRNPDGNIVKDASGKDRLTTVPLVNATLLVDRFVLVGTQLQPRMEVRYQRSRSKTRPANRKDSLGPKDLDGNVFFEPTQELRFIGDVTGGRFTALLLPTAIAETQRWQIFVCKERKDSAGNVTDSWIDSFNIERAADGLFNTLGKPIYTCVDHPELFAGKPGKCALPGKLDERLTCEKTLIPRLVTSGYAESALKFAQATNIVELANAVLLGTNFTLEAWLKPEAVTTTAPQVLCSGIATPSATTGFSLSLETNSRLRLSFDDAKKATSENILTPGKWIHIAITFDGTTCKFYANGKPAGESSELSGKATAATFLNAFGAKANAYQGTIDEIRVWRRVRSGRELQADLHQRLTGLEPGLTGYWRFDEGAGTKVFDQTTTGAHGIITGATWTPSDAPVGEHPGIERSSLRLAGRNVASGPTALLYFQQTKARTGYDRSQEKQIKQNGRVMLAVATRATGETKNFIAALDFGVTATGRLAQIPDNLTLQTVQARATDTKPLQEQLATLPEAEKNLLALRTAFAELRDARITVFSKADPAGIGFQKTFGLGQVPTGIVTTGDINANNMIVPPQLKAIHNKANDTWAIEISDAHLARLRAAEPGESPTSFSLTDIQQRINTKQKGINDIKALVKDGFNVTMPLVHTDALGLTITGGVLGFAWTNDAPLLFDSATGSLALYFRGSDDQFFVTYYTTLTTRATYSLKTADGIEAVSCLARSAEEEAEKLEIAIADDDGANPDLCTLTLSVPDETATLKETWRKVPRDAQNFAKVLNGLAGERTFLGSGRVEANGSLTMTQGIRRGLAQETTLMVGETRVQVREKVNPGETSITLDAPSTTTEILPVFYLAYDYLGKAEITDARGAAVPSDLYNGSRLVVAVPSDKSEHRVLNQTAKGGATISCQWTAAAPGTTLVFDGKTECGQADATKLDSFNATADLTIETWVRPGPIQKGAKARVLQHRTAESQYALGLEGQELQTAMEFNGSSDGVSVPAVQGLPGGNTVHTIEAWVRPTALPANRAWLMLLGGAGPGAHHWLLNKEGKTQFGVFAGAQIAPNLPLNQWTHLASTFDGTMLRVYINGALAGEIAATFNLTNVPSLPLTLAQAQLGEDFFAGQMDEVRVWKRARTQAEIVADMNRRLGGKETDLVGYWHFDGRAANDFARHQTHGKIVGAPTQAVSPLKSYNVFAGVGGQAVQSVDVFPTGNWTHLAATFRQAYGLSFDGVGNFLDAGTDLTLDINRDLTIEVFVHLNANGKRQTLLTRGKFHNQESDSGKRASQHPPYALLLDEDNKLIFAFEDVEQNLHEFKTTTAVTTGFHQLAVTRERQSMSQEDASDPSGKKIVAWDAIRFYVDKALVTADRKRYEDLAKNQPLDVGNSNEALTIASSTTIFRNGTATVFGHLTGTISEIRLWNNARDAKEFKLPNPKPADEREARTDNKDTQFIGKDITGGEKGLVAWWRFSEGSGNRAFDSKGQNHATINGATWVKSPNPEGSVLKLYINGQFNASRQVTMSAVATNQFTLGALKSDTGLREFFQGEMEEVRIWQRTRTPEQIQDNLFRRLLGEREDLLAYYTFTPDATTLTRLVDDSPRSNHLTIQGTALVFSTAPIGDDTPQVRSALAGVRTTFNDFLHSTPALQEYGDVQFDSQGNMIGVYKRGYGFIKNGEWQLITGFKVGDLVTEWIGQAQFAPQLIGYIEGAPPVPSENLTQKSDKAIGDLDDYNEASTIEIVEADETTYTYAASKAGGFDMSLEAALKFGAKSTSEAGLGLITEIEESHLLIGAKTTLEFSAGWKEDANTSVGQTTAQTTSVELRGRFTTADETTREARRRFVPDNIGLALVKSETADIFALRLKHNNALIAYQMRPNPDIPKDWNIIHFPINPRYTKQGTLDGKIGMTSDASRTLTDVDYPNALNYSPDSSYFKPIEAYALKNRIQQTETALKAYYEQYAAHLIGQRLPPFNPGASGDLGSLAPGDLLKGLPQLHKRNIVNTYVWTADGGLFAETQETMDARSESFGGEWSFQQMVGLDLKAGLIIAKVGGMLELTALVGGHLNLEVTKTQDAKSSFGLNVSLDKVERDIYLRNEDEEIVVDTSDPLRPKPKKQPGKVDAYRFLSFYLESQSEHHDQFYARVVDPIWLEQSDDPGAVALRAARQTEKKPPCWRVLHRVTYVSRVLPPLADNASASPLEKTLQTLDIESNYELIKQLEPFVADKLTTPATFTDAVRDTLTSKLPELLPHAAEIEQYLRQYFGLPELFPAAATTTPDDPLGQSSLDERAPNQAPLVGAGMDQTLKLGGASIDTTLEGSVSDDRINQAEALFVTWEKIIGDGAVTFTDRHLLKTKATFPKRGVYALRLTASDGQLSANDTMTVTVNEPPTIRILASAQPERKLDSNGIPFWEVDLKTEITTGLGDPEAQLVAVEWSIEGGKKENVEFANRIAANTKVTFKKSGSYLLKLTVDNGSFTRDAQVVMEVAARVTEQLQVLYTFEEREGESVLDVSGNATRLNLIINEPANARRVGGGVALRQATSLTTREPLTELTKALQESNEITLEAWLKPRTANVSGLRRIITCSNGPAGRNFTLGQSGRNYYVALRTTTNNNGFSDTDSNASRKVLLAGTPNTSTVAHVVCTRDKTGSLVLYVNGEEVGRRMVNGDFSAWDNSFPLALGNEIATEDGHDRSWQGEFHLVALYSRALSAAEVTQNFEFGKDSDGDAPLPPLVSAGADRIVRKQEAVVEVPLEGRVTTDRPVSALKTTWSQVSGPESLKDNRFVSAGLPQTIAKFAEVGRYVLRLTVEDGEFLVVDEVAIVIQPQPIIAHLALTEATLTKELRPFINDVPGLETDGVTYRWQQTGGPTSLTFTAADLLSCSATFVERGVYELLLQAEQGGRLWNSIPVMLTVHQRPVLDIGADQLITLPTNKVTLPRTRAVKDNGLGNPQDALHVVWEAVPETLPVSLQGGVETNTAVFAQSGIHRLRFTATNPHLETLATSAEITVIVNQAPVVKIVTSSAQPLLLSNALAEVKLEAIVSDDGLPNPEVTLQWSRANGLSGVAFTDAAAAYTTAVFSASGVYDLQLTANDGASTGSDAIQFIVHAPPSVRVNSPLNVKRNVGASLSATITDTGLADVASGTVSTTWKKLSGPAGETILAPTANTTSVIFSATGIYVFEVLADNGQLQRTATVTVNVRN